MKRFDGLLELLMLGGGIAFVTLSASYLLTLVQ